MNFIPGLLSRSAPRRSLLAAPIGYFAPRHIDRRSELLTASNQGQTSQCVAYALAGWLEYYRWKYAGVAEQIDPAPIYNRAKEIDGFPNQDGTTLEAALQAAQDIGLMSPVDQGSLIDVSTELEVKQALHRYGVVLAAFVATDAWMNPSSDGWMQPGGRAIGGHSVLLCGYSDLETPPWYALQNSWGDIGWRGFVRMSSEQFAAEFSYGLTWDWQK